MGGKTVHVHSTKNSFALIQHSKDDRRNHPFCLISRKQTYHYLDGVSPSSARVEAESGLPFIIRCKCVLHFCGGWTKMQYPKVISSGWPELLDWIGPFSKLLAIACSWFSVMMWLFFSLRWDICGRLVMTNEK